MSAINYTCVNRFEIYNRFPWQRRVFPFDTELDSTINQENEWRNNASTTVLKRRFRSEGDASLKVWPFPPYAAEPQADRLVAAFGPRRRRAKSPTGGPDGRVCGSEGTRGRGPNVTRDTIGSKDPDALKIPARRAEYSLTESALSPFHAEPTQNKWPAVTIPR